MAEKSFRDGKFSEAQMAHLRKVKLWLTPLRLAIALSVFSLAAGGPQHFFTAAPGQVFSILFAIFVVLERVFQAPDFGGEGKDKESITLGWIAFGGAYRGETLPGIVVFGPGGNERQFGFLITPPWYHVVVEQAFLAFEHFFSHIEIRPGLVDFRTHHPDIG